MTKASFQTDALSQAIPLASIARHASSGEQWLSFSSPEDLDCAWELGIFYLKVPEHLDMEGARRFGSELIGADCSYRQVPQYGELEGFIALLRLNF